MVKRRVFVLGIQCAILLSPLSLFVLWWLWDDVVARGNIILWQPPPIYSHTSCQLILLNNAMQLKPFRIRNELFCQVNLFLMSYSGYAILFNYRILHILHLGYLKFVLCFCGYPVPKNNDKKTLRIHAFFMQWFWMQLFLMQLISFCFLPLLQGTLT